MVDENNMEKDLFVNESFIHYKIIKIEDREYKFGLKEITGFEEDNIGKKAFKLNQRTGKAEFETSDANVLYLTTCIVEAPFPVTQENIRRLSSKVRNELMDFAKEINTVSEEAIKK